MVSAARKNNYNEVSLLTNYTVCEKIAILIYCWWSCKMILHYREDLILHYLAKLDRYLLLESAISLLRIYPKETMQKYKKAQTQASPGRTICNNTKLEIRQMLVE